MEMLDDQFPSRNESSSVVTACVVSEKPASTPNVKECTQDVAEGAWSRRRGHVLEFKHPTPWLLRFGMETCELLHAALRGVDRSFGVSNRTLGRGIVWRRLKVLWPLRRLHIGLSTWDRRLGSNDRVEVLWPLKRLQICLSTWSRRLGSNDPVEVLWPFRRLQSGFPTCGRRLGSNDLVELWPLRRLHICAVLWPLVV